jgi:tetratricopeptide (TPR) repeat protein
MVRVVLCAVLAACAACSTAGPRAAAARPQAPKSYLDGRDAYDAGRYEEAVRLFARAAEEAPDYAPAFLWLGTAHLRLAAARERPRTREEHARQAAAALTEAIRRSPQMRDAYVHRALAYVFLRRYDFAVRDLLHVTAVLDPDDREAHRMLAQIYFEKYEGMERQALEHYERYLALGGEDAEARQRVEHLRRFAPPAEPAPAPPRGTPQGASGAPPADREKEAEALMAQAMVALRAGRHEEVIERARRLLDEYADTAFVRRERDAIELLLREATREP